MDIPKDLAKTPHRLDDALAEFNARGGYPDHYDTGGLDLITSYHGNVPRMMQDEFFDHLAEHEATQDELKMTFEQEVSPQLPSIEQLRNLRFVRLGWPENKEELAKRPVNVIFFPFQSDWENNPPLAWQSRRLATLTDEPTIVIEPPSRSRQYRGYSIYQDAASQAAELLASFGVTHINATGHSMGAEEAAELAANAGDYGLDVDNLFISGAPRIKQRGILRLFGDLMKQVNTYKSAHRFPYDRQLRAASPETTVQKPGSVIKHFRHVGPLSLARYVREMRQAKLQHVLEKAMIRQPNMKVTLGITSHDTVAPKQEFLAVRNNLLAQKRFQDRIRTIILPGGDHAFMDGAFWPERASLVFTGRTDNRTKAPVSSTEA